jgi:hypothetical protein
MHSPQSALWFKTGDFQVHEDRVSILDVLPTLAEYYGVDAPEEEGMTRPGRSILQKLGIAPYRRALPRERGPAEAPAEAFPEGTPSPHREPAHTDAR